MSAQLDAILEAVGAAPCLPGARCRGRHALLMTDEYWLPVPGWEGWYSISNRLRVRTEPRTVERANGAQFTAQGCIRRLDERKSGALMCKLRRPGYEQTIHVGRLVDELFGTEAPANNGHPPANNGHPPSKH